MKKQDSQPQPTTHSCQVFLSKKVIWMRKSNALLEFFQALKATLWKYAVLGLQWQQWQRPSNHHHHPPPWPAELSTLEFNVPSSVTQPAIMAQLRPTKAPRETYGKLIGKLKPKSSNMFFLIWESYGIMKLMENPMENPMENHLEAINIIECHRDSCEIKPL